MTSQQDIDRAAAIAELNAEDAALRAALRYANGAKPVNIMDYQAVGDGSADDTTALAAAIAAVNTSGGTLLVPLGKTIKYTSALPIPAHFRAVGLGRSSVLKGPGLTCLLTANASNDADIYIANLLMDGTGFDTTSIGLDFLACSMVTLDRVKFLGFKDQVVFDQGQRLRKLQCEHVATTNTRSGLLVPWGPEIHAGVVAASATSNIVQDAQSHYNFNASAAGIPIIDDGGLQHLYDGVQCSYGAHSMYVCGVDGVELRGCDFEFATGDTITTSNTTFVGGVVNQKVAALTVGPGNYFDKQVDLTGTDMCLDIGNQFHIASLPVYKNLGSMQSFFSLASSNVAASGTLTDGTNPTGNFFAYDRTGIATLRNTLLAFNFRANGGGNPLTNPQFFVTSLPTTVNFSTNKGFGIDQNGQAVINGAGLRTQDGSGTDRNTLDDNTGAMLIKAAVQRGLSAPAYSSSITPNAKAADWQTITVTNSTAFTINAPTNPPDAAHTQTLTVEVLNSSGGAMGAITWNAAFVFSGLTWTNPASTKKRRVTFGWNGSAWVAVSIATTDY